jgi:hypothetical protein
MFRPNKVVFDIAPNMEPPQLYEERHHLKHPIPRLLQIRTVGSAVTELEWKKFWTKSIEPLKLTRYCERKNDGFILFYGEGGIEAALELQHKFNKIEPRFHFVISSNSKVNAMIAFDLAKTLELAVLEGVEYPSKH